MVETGVTAAARVACRLPRVHSWAVSGTPVRKDVQDLHGLLIFLGYKPLSDSPRMWSHLITNHRHLFKRIFGDIALRHTKAHIRDELHLPPQKRVVLTVPFSAVEQQHYSTLFNEFCKEVGLNTDGSPKYSDWDPERYTETMRNWLVRLRQTCLHPQVGGRNRRALGRRQDPLRTVAEVLEVMIDQNETSVRVEERAVIAAQLLQAHILGNNAEDEHRSEKALEVYKRALSTSVTLVQEAREKLDAGINAARDKGNAIENDEESDAEGTNVLGPLRNNLRTALQLQHACAFFAATAYFQIKTNENLTKEGSEAFRLLEEQESSLYETAKTLRKEILSDISRKVDVLMQKIQDLLEKGWLMAMPEINDLEYVGIEGRRIVEKSDDLFDLIREQSAVICKWRAKMAEYLLKPLVDQDDEETTGEEYETSTKQQDELYVYFDAVKAMQADLNTFITGEAAPLIDHEVKTLIRDAKWFLNPEIETDSVAPPHAPELCLDLLGTRNRFRLKRDEVGSIRGLIQEARTIESSLQHSTRGENERSCVQKHLQGFQKVFSDYTKALTGLEKEIDLFRTTQNQRLEFYRQLQELSDAVGPYKEELDEACRRAKTQTLICELQEC
jgi:E3 ubiquitin-protein ligase SHPRH